MAITVKDIQEKDFPLVASGYDGEQVDDFLDAIAEQLGALIRENLLLKSQNAKLEEELNSKEKALKEVVTQSPDYNEEGYFKNLQSTMRDTLISAQRVADDTISDAKAAADQLLSGSKAQADQILAKAQAEAASMTERAQNSAEIAKNEYESIKAATEAYRTAFRQLVEGQVQILKSNDILFK